MVVFSESALLEFKQNFQNSLENLPISVVSRSTAIVNDVEYPVKFDFVTETLVDHKKQVVTTNIIEIEGTIPGTIKIGSLQVIPQHIHITCEYEILSITNNELKALLQDEKPMLLYSDWLLEAIENEILVLEVKVENDQVIDWPVGIKNAYFL
ncbi:hypothetical protein DCE79_12700 [Lysinibacillus sp. 2017]|uniref:hypothetical protein n=1 Tax=unclassified Lysinibacillus TaxID=2636778 RepID=UPI000D529B21|nr:MULTISPECIES: hypothetical protein [unclassified Lysinibacillus]AWE08200.1 hypothetical protein DCE79_12700 [Lysinibacillus sp. 2017]TGN36296.1 hypothetical protein E4L99_05245 [Lysinibacillus sp. S2017]